MFVNFADETGQRITEQSLSKVAQEVNEGCSKEEVRHMHTGTASVCLGLRACLLLQLRDIMRLLDTDSSGDVDMVRVLQGGRCLGPC